ncbi:MAG: hypothetical protein V3V78_00460 [Candidatus Woesearchaeota archaeon]
MKIGSVFKNQWGLYEVVAGFEKKGNRKKMLVKRLGEYILKGTPVTLERMSASQALERIMDICGINQDDKFQIRANFNSATKPTKRNIPNVKQN